MVDRSNQQDPVVHPIWRSLNPFIGPLNKKDRAHRKAVKAQRVERSEARAKMLSARKLAKEYRREGILHD